MVRFRDGSGAPEILVFQHPEAGLQVPAGTVEAGEAPEAAVLREVLEEAGIARVEIRAKLDTYELYRESHRQWHRRHVFLLAPTEALPEAWEQTVVSDGEDSGLRLAYLWLGLEEAAARLAGGFGVTIGKVPRKSP